MTKTSLSVSAIVFSIIVSMMVLLSPAANASVNESEYPETIIEKSNGVYDFKDQGSPAVNRRRLNDLIENNKKVTVNIKEDIQIDTYLRPGSNTTINAKGHSVVVTESKKGVALNEPKKLNYKGLTNVAFIGGTYSVKSNSSSPQTIFRFAHASDLTFENVKIRDGYNDHAIELIACKNCVIKKCDIQAEGKCGSKCVEEQVQIDLADKYSAPGILRNCGKKFVNGAPCVNVKVVSSKVKGARAVCANFAGHNAKNRKADNYHSKILINDCDLIGVSSEALALFNTKSATVEKCTIDTKAKKSRDAYSIGLHVAYMKGSGPKASTSNKILLKGNKVKGGRNGIQVFSHNKSKFGTVIISNNTVYSTGAKSDTIKANKDVAKKLTKSGNKIKKW